jgi:hypothetical protein
MPALPLNTYPVVPQKRILNRVFCFFFVAVARVSRGFSTFFRCPHNCIFEYSTGHNGPSRTRNTNLAPLAPETMLSQPILIELLTVLFLWPTYSFPPLSLVMSDYQHVWRVRVFILILLHKMRMKFWKKTKKRVSFKRVLHQNLVYFHVLKKCQESS